jgi:hypothetical protein
VRIPLRLPHDTDFSLTPTSLGSRPAAGWATGEAVGSGGAARETPSDGPVAQVQRARERLQQLSTKPVSPFFPSKEI